MNNRFKLPIILFAISILTINCDSEITQNTAGTQLNTAYNFKLPHLKDEKEFTLDQFKGKPVVLNFWATWCSPCRKEMPFLQQSWEKYKQDGLIFIGINVLDDPDNAYEFLKSFNINYLNLLDKSGTVSGKYGVIALPATFFIDKNGNIYKQNYGPFLGDSGEKLFNKYLEEIL